ncbi:MAG: J domain-containing protein [Pyrinomonadaceae bacterium]
MTSQSNLEIKGYLKTNPLAELLAETSDTNLNGSLRLSNEDQKIVVYLSAGVPVFAVSNARRHRLFETLLKNEKISKQQMVEIPNFTNDIELAETLKSKELLSSNEVESAFSGQISEIVKTALCWTDGEWTFTPLARVKENIQFNIPLQPLLLEYARSLSSSFIVKRFESFNETFGVNSSVEIGNDMLPQEAFVLSRFEKTFLTIDQIKNLSGLPEIITLQILYTLWLGGYLYRQNWNPAFTRRKISEINSTRLSLKKDEKPAEAEVSLPPKKSPVLAPLPLPEKPVGEMPPQESAAEKLTLEEYLDRGENYESYYDLLGVASDTDSAEIKRNYFSIAKRFHPDRFHKEKDSVLLQRIQNAFTRTAQAYETLKNEETRKTYNYKIDKNLLSAKEKGKSVEVKKEQSDVASEAFERGFSLLMEEDYEEAIPFLTRAVQLAPDNARYHAYFGKVLSMDDSLRHKADTEMQTAIRLEPQNATFRLIISEFYIQFGLFRRAEGELQRLLAMYPDNKEAQKLLDGLRDRQ